VARPDTRRQDVVVPTLTATKTYTAGAVLVAATLLGLTGCTTPATTPVSQPTTQSPAGPPASTVVAPPPTTAPAAACPVDAATLETAFKANTALASAIVLGGGLTRITCYQGYAVAHTTPTNVDPALVLFVYDRGTHTWAAVTGGTAVPCGEHGVPAAVVAHLPGCAP
jgi:hypothetical protein